MKSIRDWTVSTQLLGGAAVLGAIVASVNSIDAIADMQPIATKSYVVAQNTEVVEILQQIRWDQAIDRLNQLDFQIGQLTAQEIVLKDAVEAETNITERQDKEARLTALRRDIAMKVETLAELRCKIEARSTKANCD